MITMSNWRERMVEDMRLHDLRPRTIEGYAGEGKSNCTSREGQRGGAGRRTGGVAVYDVTTGDPRFVELLQTRDFTGSTVGPGSTTPARSR